jgi:hypothetical protein
MTFEPFEIKNAILRKLGLQIVAGGEGRKFPHPGIELFLLAPDGEQKNIFEAAFGQNRLQEEVHAYLQMPRCLKATPAVSIEYIEQTDNAEFAKSGFQIGYSAKAVESPVDVYLEITEGYANRKEMRLGAGTTYIGRTQKVLNKHGGIERVNDLYFPDVREMSGRVQKSIRDLQEINSSVSRLHAHIKYAGGHHFLFDDRSSRGTTILPEGRGTSQSVDSVSGKKLAHNDIISFGKAVVRVRVVKRH